MRSHKFLIKALALAVLLLVLVLLFLSWIIFFSNGNGRVINEDKSLELIKIQCDEKIAQEDKTNCIDLSWGLEAFSTGNVDLCENIYDERLKENCKQRTIIIVAIKDQQISNCKEAPNSRACEDSFYYSKAISENDFYFCSKILDKGIKKECLSQQNNGDNLE